MMCKVMGPYHTAEYFAQLWPSARLCQSQWLGVSWLLSIPICQIPNFHESRGAVVGAEFQRFVLVPRGG